MTHELTRMIPSRIMTVLPPKEGFSPEQVGAIGLLVHRLAQPHDWIVGPVLAREPFPDRHYLKVQSAWFRKLYTNKSYVLGVASLVKRYQPRLIEVHNRPELALYLARKYPLIPVILILHNDPLTMRHLRTEKQRQCLCDHVHVVTVSEWLKQRFLTGKVQGTVTCLPNSIQLRHIPPFVPLERREKTILFVGRVVADKGVDLFLHLCHTLLRDDPGWKVEIVGADRFDHENRETDFIRDIRKLIDNKHIFMLGYVPHHEVLQKMATASVVILPSRWPEPFGMTALETMACGTPLLVSDRGALPDVVGEGALLIDPDRMDYAYETLAGLLANKELQQDLSRKARQRAMRFDADQALTRLNRFRKSICSSLSLSSY